MNDYEKNMAKVDAVWEKTCKICWKYKNTCQMQYLPEIRKTCPIWAKEAQNGL